MSKHRIIPIFIPHVGCPHDCVFCNQAKITGQLRAEYDQITGESVRETIERYLETIDRSQSTVEVSFFGGTFTAINLKKQKELLAAAKKAKSDGCIDFIRLSTRPDYINLPIMDHLKSYGVDIVELGVQSMDEDVLKRSRRGYDKKAVYQASRLIREFGMTLGHQLMIGLPGDTREKDFLSLQESIAMKPDLVRIYPALVIKDTEMEEAFLSGDYQPYGLDEAVEIAALMMQEYEKNDIRVIRIGLQPTEEINENADVIAGPFHPSIRELAESYLLIKRISETMYEEMEVVIGEKDLSRLYAGGKRYFRPLLEEKKVHVKVVPDKCKNIIEIIPYHERGVL